MGDDFLNEGTELLGLGFGGSNAFMENEGTGKGTHERSALVRWPIKRPSFFVMSHTLPIPCIYSPFKLISSFASASLISATALSPMPSSSRSADGVFFTSPATLFIPASVSEVVMREPRLRSSILVFAPSLDPSVSDEALLFAGASSTSSWKPMTDL